MEAFQVSTPKMTCLVEVEGGVIVRTAPILYKFTGQKWGNLIKWLRKQGRLRVVELDNGNWTELEGDEHALESNR